MNIAPQLLHRALEDAIANPDPEIPTALAKLALHQLLALPSALLSRAARRIHLRVLARQCRRSAQVWDSLGHHHEAELERRTAFLADQERRRP